jgi:hypothetical protein
MTSVGIIFYVQEKSMHKNFNFSHAGVDQSTKLNAPVGSADSLFVEAQSAQLTSLVGHAVSSKSAKPTAQVGSADSLVTSPVNSPKKLPNRSNVTSSDFGANLYDWRTPLLIYLRDPSAKVDKSVWRSAFQVCVHNDELYRRTTEVLLLKCLGSDQARVAMGEVHEGICGTHQSAPNMKWLLCRADFYWPTMMADCFRYYKGCEECQRFGNIQLVHMFITKNV